MIVASQHGQYHEVKQRAWGGVAPPFGWSYGPAGWGEAQIMGSLGVTNWATGSMGAQMSALELAAVAAAVRLVSESVGSCICRVYQGDALEREPLYDAAQAHLLQNPAPGLSSFDVWSDVAASIETAQAGFLWKVKDRSGVVVELWPLDPDYMMITGQLAERRVWAIRRGDKVDVTADVIPIRAWSPRPTSSGVSATEMHRKSLGWARGYEEYRGRYFQNDGTVPQVIENGPSDSNQREDMAKGWAKMNSGPRNAGKIGILWGQASLKQLGSNLRDSQAAELALAVAQDVARMFRIVPAALLYAEMGRPQTMTVEAMGSMFYRFSLMHRVRRIERALAADRELFPDPAIYPRFDVMEFIRGDFQTMAVAAHEGRQDGTLNLDESRALGYGLPPLPDGAGKDHIEIPVGGGGDVIGPGANPAGTD